MSELSRFVRDRNVDNVFSGEVVTVFPENPDLAEVSIPGSGVVTLATAESLALRKGLIVMVALPGGDLRKAYIKGKAAVVFGSQSFNKVLGTGQG